MWVVVFPTSKNTNSGYKGILKAQQRPLLSNGSSVGPAASYLQSVIRIALYPAAGKLFDSYTPMFSQRQTTQQAKTINIFMVPVLGRYM